MLSLIPDFLADNPAIALAGLIIVVGLFIVGLKDLLRFSPTRLWAISTVALQQSVRRRVLWITPPLMLGVIIVCQFQKPVDAQDAIRQNTVVCLFATGLLVTLLTIILAATNLPREIENRVIYTIATKPATRLEIVVGKVIGFARVSFWLLLIMGLFSWAYLHVRNYTLRNHLTAQLATPGAVDDAFKPTFEHYRDHGLLRARQLGLPDSLGIYSHLPANPADRWAPGSSEGEIVTRFTIDRLRIPAADVSSDPPRGGVVLTIPILVRKTAPDPAPSTAPSTAPANPPTARISIALLSADRSAVITDREFGQPQGYDVPDTGGLLQLYVHPKLLQQIIPQGPAITSADIILQVTCYTHNYEFTVSPDGLAIIVPETRHRFLPTSELAFAGRSGQYGQQFRGGRDAPDRVAIYSFTGQKPRASPAQTRLLEVRLGVEREEDQATQLTLDLLNRTTGQVVRNIQTTVENNQPVYLNVPVHAVDSGDFDVVLRTLSNAYLGLRAGPAASIRLIRHDQPFAFNLLKSLLVIWLLSLLVTIIAVFASTFLSWPIAVVLTVMILAGHWAAEQFADTTSSGLGRQIVNDLMPRDANPASARAVSESVDALVATLRTVAAVLPDISQYSAIQDIQQGVAISPAAVLLPSLRVTFGFGLPLLVLAYVFLKYKEVAP